jgi:hypothetical protein
VRSLQNITSGVFFSRRFNLVAFGVIAAITVIAYSNTFTAVFHFDDMPSIVDNYLIKRVTAENISAILQGVRPVVYLSLMLNYALGGLNVVGYHVFNIAVHIANSFFVYLLISRTLGLPALRDKYDTGQSRRMALFAALLFSIHPVQTEAVTYIISRTELLATFFYLASLLFFIKAVRDRKPAYYTGVFVSAALSMASKEWAVTLPAILMLYDYLFLSDRSVKRVFSHWSAFLLAAVPWMIVASNLNLMTNTSVGFHMAAKPDGVRITPLAYLFTSFNVLWTYIRVLVLPIHQNLDYTYPVSQTLFVFPTLFSFIGHLAVVGTAFWLFKKKGWTLVPFGVAWFYITISPTQSFVPVADLIFEHRLYLPSIGFFLMFVTAVEMLARQLQKGSSPAALAVGVNGRSNTKSDQEAKTQRYQETP